MLLTVTDIAGMLNDRIEQLCHVLLPNGQRDGVEWRVGSVAGEKGRSMAVRIKGSKVGVWSDFSSGQGGDALDLVSAVLFRDNKGEAVAWARSWLGLDGLDPNRIEQKRREAKAEAEKRQKQSEEEIEKMRSSARRLWHSATTNIVATPVYHYLLARGIDVQALPKVPGSLRYAAECWCNETNGHLPAMVAMIQGDEGMLAAHRTYLARQPDGSWKKAKLGDAKKTLGRYAGGFITLNRGASGKPIKEAPEGDQVIIAEGIETGLSVALGLPECRVLAAVSVSNFQNISLPAAIRKVTLAVDNDGDNAQAAAAVDAAIERFMREGREVLITRSPVGKDFNDLLMSQMQKKTMNSEARA